MAGLRIIMIALLSCLWAVPSAALNLSQAENRLLEYGEVRYFFDDQGLTAEQVMAAVDTLDWQQASSALLTPVEIELCSKLYIIIALCQHNAIIILCCNNLLDLILKNRPSKRLSRERSLTTVATEKPHANTMRKTS